MAEPVVVSIMEFSGNPDEVLGKMKGVEETTHFPLPKGLKSP